MKGILISAGEPSGDMHAAQVVRSLMRRRPGISVEAVGGPHLEASGTRLIQRITGLSAMGLTEAVGTLPEHIRLLARLSRRMAEGRYEMVILVDYPGFHLRLARIATRFGTPVLYYIAPQLWAWAPWRARILRRYVRQLAVILPFEEPYFARLGVASTFVGHPLLDRPSLPGRSAARAVLGIGPREQVLALLPGRRPSDVRRHWEVFRQAALVVRRRLPGVQIVVAGPPATVGDYASEFLFWQGDPAFVFAAADAALCKSGTATLEAALANLPMVIAYRMHPATFLVARKLVRVPYVGLVNLVAERAVAPEFLQSAAHPRALADALLPLFDRDGPEAGAQRGAFSMIRERLGRPGAADRVAELAERLAA
jgi:lipid-A-disaccharide synthase